MEIEQLKDLILKLHVENQKRFDSNENMITQLIQMQATNNRNMEEMRQDISEIKECQNRY